jgi:hypothetical protein
MLISEFPTRGITVVGRFEVESAHLDTLRAVRNNAQASVIEAKSKKIRQWHLQEMANEYPDYAGVRDDTDLARRLGPNPYHLRNDTFLQIPKALTSRGSEVSQILPACTPKFGMALPYTVPGNAVPLAEVNFTQFPAALNTYNTVFKDDSSCFGGPLQVARPCGGERHVLEFFSPATGLQPTFQAERRIRLSNEAIGFRLVDRPMAQQVEGRHSLSDDPSGRAGECQLSRVGDTGFNLVTPRLGPARKGLW